MSHQTRLQGMSVFSLAMLAGNLLFQRHVSIPDIPFHGCIQLLLYGLLALAVYTHIRWQSLETFPAYKRYITLIILYIILIIMGLYN